MQAYLDRSDGWVFLPNSLTSAPATVVQLTLPAGRYALDFTGRVYAPAPASRAIDCYFQLDGNAFQMTVVKVGQAADASEEQVLAMTDAQTLEKESRVSVACEQREGGDSRWVLDARLRALTVSAIEQQ